jgi:hypothetical protein
VGHEVCGKRSRRRRVLEGKGRALARRNHAYLSRHRRSWEYRSKDGVSLAPAAWEVIEVRVSGSVCARCVLEFSLVFLGRYEKPTNERSAEFAKLAYALSAAVQQLSFVLVLTSLSGQSQWHTPPH